jgi:hypothetical protein
MRAVSCLRALPILAVLTIASASARAEVPQSRVLPPKEDRLGPRERALQEDEGKRVAEKEANPGQWIAAHRTARRMRSAGIALTAVGLTFAPLGGTLLAESLSKPRGETPWGTLLGGGMLAIGGLSLTVGIPMLVSGVSGSRAAVMPAIQVGPRSAALTWSF